MIAETDHDRVDTEIVARNSSEFLDGADLGGAARRRSQMRRLLIERRLHDGAGTRLPRISTSNVLPSFASAVGT